MKAITAKQCFDGRALIEDAVIFYENDLIVEVGKKQDLITQLQNCEEVADVPFLMPGFIDCHMHMVLTDEVPAMPQEWADFSIKMLQGLEDMRKAGVVACRDLGSAGGASIAVANAIKAGELKGVPYVVAAGQALVTTGGHGYTCGLECDGPTDFMRGCRQVIKDGADVIKVMMSGGVNSPGEEPGPPEVTDAEIAAAVEVAHSRGKKVAVHAHGATAMKRSLDAGVDSIEHGVFSNEALIEQMVEQGTALVPTLSAPYYAVKEGLRQDPDNPDHAKSREIVSRHNAVTRLAFERGVKLGMGSDAGCPFNPHDQANFEAVLLAKIGIPILDVLKIATLNSAEILGIDKKYGSLEVGKKASMVALAACPCDDLEAITGEKQVFIDGELVIS